MRFFLCLLLGWAAVLTQTPCRAATAVNEVRLDARNNPAHGAHDTVRGYVVNGNPHRTIKVTIRITEIKVPQDTNPRVEEFIVPAGGEVYVGPLEFVGASG